MWKVTMPSTVVTSEWVNWVAQLTFAHGSHCVIWEPCEAHLDQLLPHFLLCHFQTVWHFYGGGAAAAVEASDSLWPWQPAKPISIQPYSLINSCNNTWLCLRILFLIIKHHNLISFTLHSLHTTLYPLKYQRMNYRGMQDKPHPSC